MRIFVASALLVLSMSAPAFAWDHWAIVRNHTNHVVAGPYHDRAMCDRILHHKFNPYRNHCARI